MACKRSGVRSSLSPPIWTQIHVASVTWIFCCNKAPSFKIKEGASFPAALRVAFLFPDFLCNGFIKKKRGFAVCQGFMMAMDGNIEVREKRCKARFSAYSFTGEVAQDEARRI